jgi:CubicO group peptidase (beta-lactamase class C family)
MGNDTVIDSALASPYGERSGMSVPITLVNWQDPEHLAWSYRHIGELITTARVRRADRASPLRLSSSLPVPAARAPGALAARRLLDDDATDGLIVLHRGEVVLEEYRRAMRSDDVHLLQSVSKSITGTLTGILVGQGALAASDAVTAHVPELAGTSFDGASVQDLLDMRAATRFDENYADPASDIRISETQFGWAPGPPPARDAVAYLSTLTNHRQHGGRFEYRSILTDVLGLVLERASGRPFAETLGHELWAPMGAETDASVTVTADGFAVADGGISVSLRDLARFGRLVLEDGAVDGRRIVPAQWLTDTLAGDDDARAAFAQDEHSVELPGGHYRNQWWVPPGRRVLLGLGIHGQFLFVDRGTDTVIALLSTWPTPLDAGRHRTAVDAFWATAGALGAA